jgi:hypothetical protein
MSDLSIVGLTVSCEIADKKFGDGTSRFLSASAKCPEGSAGVPIALADEIVMKDGIELYFTAWQTLLQTRYATGEITDGQYTEQTIRFMRRIERIGQLYQKIKNKTPEQLDAYLERLGGEGKNG